MADKKKSTKKEPKDLPKSRVPRQEVKKMVNPKTGKVEDTIILYD